MTLLYGQGARWVLGLTALLAMAATPQRIVSTSPVVTEILYGVGAFDRVVAVTEYCTYPPEAKVIIHDDNWRWGPSERFVFREHEGRGYWRGDRWVTW